MAKVQQTPNKDFEVEEDDKAENITKLNEIGQTIATIRKKPLLLIFYPDDGGSIRKNDVYILEKKLDEKLKDYDMDLDVVIHTTGGDPKASYLIAQLIRNYCSRMDLFVPYYSYSGGTLIALASDLINLGRTALLSPIDLQLGSKGNPEQFPLLSIEKFIEFAEDSCKSIKFTDEKNKTDYIIALIEKLTYEIKPTELGAMFRLKDLTKYYAQILLRKYMLKNESNRDRQVDFIIERLTGGSPDHDFDIDIHIATGIGLKAREMDDNIYKLSRLLIGSCNKLLNEGVICNFYSDSDSTDRKPFFEVFYPKEVKKDE